MARRSRRQREASTRFWGGVVKLSLTGGLVAAIAYYAYEVGQQLGMQNATALRSEIEHLTTESAQQAQTAQEMKDKLTATEKELADLRTRYQAVSVDEMQAIIEQVRQKLGQGISAERLTFILSQAQEAKNCTNPETRRFLAKTGNYDGANTWVRFHERITITGRGEAANSGREQWFDPAAPVTLTFTPQGGKEQVISGVLPLQHAMLFKDKEYRFTATAGTRGFVEVAGEWCDFRD